MAVGTAGLAAAAVAAGVGGFPAGDAARLLAYSVAGSVVAGIVAGALLFALRRATIGVQAAVAALAAVLAVAIGVAWASSQMFLMKHDLRVLWVVLISAGTVGLVVAVLFGRRVANASRSVGEMARRLGESGPGADLFGRRSAAVARAGPHPASWPCWPPSWRRRRPGWPRPRRRRRRWNGAVGSWSPGCRTICAHRWPGSGP